MSKLMESQFSNTHRRFIGGGPVQAADTWLVISVVDTRHSYVAYKQTYAHLIHYLLFYTQTVIKGNLLYIYHSNNIHMT